MNRYRWFLYITNVFFLSIFLVGNGHGTHISILNTIPEMEWIHNRLNIQFVLLGSIF